MSEEIASADSLLIEIARLQVENALLIDRAMRQVQLLHLAYDTLLNAAYAHATDDRAARAAAAVAAQILTSLEELSD